MHIERIEDYSIDLLRNWGLWYDAFLTLTFSSDLLPVTALLLMLPANVIKLPANVIMLPANVMMMITCGGLAGGSKQGEWGGAGTRQEGDHQQCAHEPGEQSCGCRGHWPPSPHLWPQVKSTPSLVSVLQLLQQVLNWADDDLKSVTARLAHHLPWKEYSKGWTTVTGFVHTT